MKLFLFLSVILGISIFSTHDLKSQPRQVISASGGSELVGDFDLAWTLGQIEVQTVEFGDFILTQGFQQPFANPLEIDPQESNSLPGIFISPNPCIDFFEITFKNCESGEYEVNLINLSGQVIFSKNIQNVPFENNLNQSNNPQKFIFETDYLTKGMYLLVIKNWNDIRFYSQKIIVE